MENKTYEREIEELLNKTLDCLHKCSIWFLEIHKVIIQRDERGNVLLKDSVNACKPEGFTINEALKSEDGIRKRFKTLKKLYGRK